MIILHNDETFHHLKSHTQTLVTPQLQDVPDTFKTKNAYQTLTSAKMHSP